MISKVSHDTEAVHTGLCTPELPRSVSEGKGRGCGHQFDVAFKATSVICLTLSLTTPSQLISSTFLPLGWAQAVSLLCLCSSSTIYLECLSSNPSSRASLFLSRPSSNQTLRSLCLPLVRLSLLLTPPKAHCLCNQITCSCLIWANHN